MEKGQEKDSQERSRAKAKVVGEAFAFALHD